MPDSRSSQVHATAGNSSRRQSAGATGPADVGGTTAPGLEDDRTVISSRGPITDLDDSPLAPPLEVGKMLEGERLGQFVLQKYVGGGGMGVVFKALDTTLNREVAVKVLARSQSQDEETLRRFQNEAQSAARLDHGNIARVYYVGQDRGVHYIVFEFIEGINIRDLVQQNGPLPLADAVSYTLQVAEALAHASQRDVIHRDIKPSNVLITPDGKAKLVDMGLARLLQVEHADHELTASGVTLGTFDYISPEQARDPRSADVRSDLYSLGCSFYFMLTGRPPFPEGTVLQKLLQHQGDDPPDPRNFRPDLPAEVTTILTRLLAKNPARRYQNPTELIAELSAVGERAGLPSTAFTVNYRPLVRHSPLARFHKHLPWAIPLAALVLIVLALDYVWSAGNEAGSPGPAAGVPGAAPLEAPATDASGAARRPGPPLAVAARSDPRAAPAPSAGPAAGSPDAIGSASTSGTPRRVTTATKNSPPVLAASGGKTLTASGGKVPGPLAAADSANAASNSPPDDEIAPAPLPGDNFARWLSSALGRGEHGLDRMKRWFATPVGEADAPHADAAGPLAAGPQPGGLSSIGSASVARPAVARPGVLVVAPDRAGAGMHPSLMAALGAAKTGDVIELDFDGRREERPLTLSNTSIKIRAAEGRRPVIVFRPADADPVGYPRSMVTVAGGSLTTSDVQWELDVPRKISADAWTLFETRRAELLRIERAVLTIRNASSGGSAFHPAVAVFDTKSPPGSDSMAMKTGAMPAGSIEITDSLVRGEATILRSDELEPVRFSLARTLVVTTETLLLTRGANAQARTGAKTQIELRGVTALVFGGLARMSDDDSSTHLLSTAIHADDALLVTAADVAWLDQRGIDSVEHFQELVDWSATRVVFAGTNQFWRMTNTISGQSTQLDFAAWEAFWGPSRQTDCRHLGETLLARPTARDAASATTPSAVSAAIRPAIVEEGAPDTLPGCDLDQLPQPVAEATEPAAE